VKHVLITGGNDGLGKVLAGKLAALGYAVTILGKAEDKTQAVARKLDCAGVVADISDYGAAERAVHEAEVVNGPIDILVNNAGIWVQDKLMDNDPQAIQRTLEVNALGTIYMSKLAAASMGGRGGRIINVNSQAGLSAKAERTVYNASKWAVTGFTKSLQLELRPLGIAVTGFYPGAMDTGLFDKSGNGRDMSRALDPAIAADAIVYVCGLPDHVEMLEIGIGSMKY
jgi:NAD(P)-dependent dehydrogenase (short-subunit alcohol dehydrogenase family)